MEEHKRQESEERSSLLLPGETAQIQFRPASEGELDTFMRELPPWFTKEMLQPGAPIIVPAGDTSTVVLPGGTIREREPGSWQQRVGPREELEHIDEAGDHSLEREQEEERECEPGSWQRKPQSQFRQWCVTHPVWAFLILVLLLVGLFNSPLFVLLFFTPSALTSGLLRGLLIGGLLGLVLLACFSVAIYRTTRRL